MKYIDADKLIEGIKHIQSKFPVITYAALFHLIASLQQEQPEVDLEKEYQTWWNSISGKINVEHIMEWYMHETAHHFAEWGAIHLNARKEDTK